MKSWLPLAACLLSFCFPLISATPSGGDRFSGSLTLLPSTGSTDREELQPSSPADGNLSDLSPAAAGEPRLTIAPAPGGFIVSWPKTATNWVLEESRHLQRPIPWIRVPPDGYFSDATRRYVVPVDLEQSHYFQLRNLGPAVPAIPSRLPMRRGPPAALVLGRSDSPVAESTRVAVAPGSATPITACCLAPD